MKKISSILLIILFASYIASAQDIHVTAKLDSAHVLIGDQLNYTVTLEQPAGARLSLFEPHDTLCKGIELVSGPKRDTTILAGGRLKINERYIITSFDSGYYQIPPAYAELKDSSGIRKFYSEYSRLLVTRVRMAPQDTTIKIFDIVAPYKAPLTFGELLPWILALLAVAALVWGVIILAKKLKRKENVEEPVIIADPAHVIAFRELEKLKNEKLWESGEVKLYYSRLTEILRQYLENRFAVYSLEMTTSETLDALVKSGFKKDEKYASLKSILNGADLVKFAKYKPDPDENSDHFDKSWKFVENTKPLEESPSDISKAENKEVKG
jgi:hypothetical protein